VPSEIRFSIIRKTLEDHGWRFDRVSGSHHVFTKPGSRNVIIPVHRGKVQSAYVRHIEKIIREEGR
jgi:predicted RNA binding protein YcfA (HicA-like mRNA interferase family)